MLLPNLSCPQFSITAFVLCFLTNKDDDDDDDDVHCGQTAGWMKTPLGSEVDLGPGHIVFDGDPAPLPQKGHSGPSLFGPCLLWSRSPISAITELLSGVLSKLKNFRRSQLAVTCAVKASISRKRCKMETLLLQTDH